MTASAKGVGRVTSRGDGDKLPHRLRRLTEVWGDHGYPRYFLTICVQDRQRVLASERINQRLVACLRDSPQRYGWWPTRYVIMPDHLHLLVSASPNSVSLGAWVKALKAFVALRDFRWQASFFDHVVRSDESETEKWEYIRRNPMRAGLVTKAEDWPFAGELKYERPDAASGDAAYKNR
jgi:putative transposase